MEKKFYTDDFEQFLKETADDFRMYPSKRVWNSLYNNLHPGRKWPSLSVCLLLLSSIIFIGLSHKNEITGSESLVKKDAATTLLAYQKPGVSIEQIASIPVLSPDIQRPSLATRNVSTNSTSITTGHDKKHLSKVYKNSINTNHFQSTRNNATQADQNKDLSLRVNDQLSNSVKEPATIRLSNAIAINEDANVEDKTDNQKTGNTVLEKNNIAVIPANSEIKMLESIAEITKPIINQPLLATLKNNKAAEDKEWIEDYAFHNQPTTSIKSKLAYELYVTPSIGYRTLAKNVAYDILPARSSINGTVQETPTLIQDPALNLEAGYNYIYTYSKSIRLKAGFQFNYSNYSIHAHELGHSTLTTLLLNDPAGGIELVQRSSSLANLPGDASDKKLSNNSFQVSLPFGADMKIAGKHNFQWFAGATLQPTYVLIGNGYLISSDAKNYIYDASFMRKWNINAGVETFVSYRTKTGITFNAGPQFRYQLLSSYKKKYSYDEKMYNIGLKIGMVRNF